MCSIKQLVLTDEKTYCLNVWHVVIIPVAEW